MLLVVACQNASMVPMRPLPADAYSHYLAGQLAAYRGDWTMAATELTAAAAAAPDQPVFGVVELARALAKAKREPEALAVLAKARDVWPEHPEVWLASGDLLGDADKAGAIRAYTRVMELEPDDEHAWSPGSRSCRPTTRSPPSARCAR